MTRGFAIAAIGICFLAWNLPVEPSPPVLLSPPRSAGPVGSSQPIAKPFGEPQGNLGRPRAVPQKSLDREDKNAAPTVPALLDKPISAPFTTVPAILDKPISAPFTTIPALLGKPISVPSTAPRLPASLNEVAPAPPALCGPVAGPQEPAISSNAIRLFAQPITSGHEVRHNLGQTEEVAPGDSSVERAAQDEESMQTTLPLGQPGALSGASISTVDPDQPYTTRGYVIEFCPYGAPAPPAPTPLQPR